MSGPESAGEVSFSGNKFDKINHQYVQGGPSGRGQAFVDIEKKELRVSTPSIFYKQHRGI